MLPTLVTDFASQPGVTPVQYELVIGAVQSSPELLSAIERAAQNGLQHLYSQPPAGTDLPKVGVYFYTTNVTDTKAEGNIVLTPSFLESLGTGAVGRMNVTHVLRHEVEHVFDAPDVYEADGSLDQRIAVHNAASSNAHVVQELTGEARTYIETQLEDEGRSNIAGWNAQVSAALAANNNQPLSQSQLFQLVSNYGSHNTYGDQFYDIGTDAEGEAIAIPKPGFSFNPDRSVIMGDRSNIAHAGIDQGSRIQSTSGLRYDEADLSIALNRFAADEKGRAFAENYAAFGATDESLIRNGFRTNATIVNETDLSTRTYEFSGDTATVDAASKDLQSDTVDISSTYTITKSPNEGEPPTVRLDKEVTHTTSANGVPISSRSVFNQYSPEGLALQEVDLKFTDANLDKVNDRKIYDVTPDASDRPPIFTLASEAVTTTSLDGLTATTQLYSAMTGAHVEIDVTNDYSKRVTNTTTIDYHPKDGVNSCTVDIQSSPIGSQGTLFRQSTEDLPLAGGPAGAVSGTGPQRTLAASAQAFMEEAVANWRQFRQQHQEFASLLQKARTNLSHAVSADTNSKAAAPEVGAGYEHGL